MVGEQGDYEVLEQHLFATLNWIITQGKHLGLFKNYDPTSNHLSVDTFTRFILVPFVAVTLISQDHPSFADFDTALLERNKSNVFGELFHSDEDDDKLHEIHRQNLLAIRNKRKREEPDEPAPTLPPPAIAPPRFRAKGDELKSLKVY
jgi:hypothetical protein